MTLRFTLEGLHQRHPNYISPGTKKGIKYRSQQALEGLRAFGWKVSGLRPGSSCQDIRTGTLSNQVAWRILQTKAGSFLTVKVRTMIKVVKVLQMYKVPVASKTLSID